MRSAQVLSSRFHALFELLLEYVYDSNIHLIISYYIHRKTVYFQNDTEQGLNFKKISQENKILL